MDERETMPVSVESVETQSDTGEISVGADAEQGTSVSGVEQETDILEQPQEDAVEALVESPAVGREISNTLASDRVEEIVDAVLASDRVTGLLDSFEFTLQTVADAVTATSEAEEREEQEPIIVISADELLDRLEARQAESAEAAQAAVRSSPMGAQTVTAAMTKSGELVLPEEGEVTLDVIEALIEGLISFFTEDGTEDGSNLLATIKDRVEEIAVNVEPHPLMETPFEDYTVTEGLLLIVVLWFVVLNPCIRMIKGGFSWLLS